VTDLEFVRKCSTGDSQSWDEFLKRYSRLIYKYIHSVLNSKNILASNQDYVNDIFQEFFSSLIQNDYKKIKTFKAKNNCSLASWLRQVVINFTLDYLRAVKPAVSLDVEMDEG
jgi:RNA polymerase sigma factor (sigma-70 family)